jgi:predicted nucleic acid-binding protein
LLSPGYTVGMNVATYRVDTSTLLKLLIEEDGSQQAALIWDTADSLASAALIVVEGRAALAAAERSGRLTRAEWKRAKADLAELIDEMSLVELTEGLIGLASGLAEDEQLRGYDAMHLAAALTVEAEILTSADAALCDAAERRGLHVANPLNH